MAWGGNNRSRSTAKLRTIANKKATYFTDVQIAIAVKRNKNLFCLVTYNNEAAIEAGVEICSKSGKLFNWFRIPCYYESKKHGDSFYILKADQALEAEFFILVS